MEDILSSFTSISAFLVGIMFLAAFLNLWQDHRKDKTREP